MAHGNILCTFTACELMYTTRNNAALIRPLIFPDAKLAQIWFIMFYFKRVPPSTNFAYCNQCHILYCIVCHLRERLTDFNLFTSNLTRINDCVVKSSLDGCTTIISSVHSHM